MPVQPIRPADRQRDTAPCHAEHVEHRPHPPPLVGPLFALRRVAFCRRKCISRVLWKQRRENLPAFDRRVFDESKEVVVRRSPNRAHQWRSAKDATTGKGVEFPPKRARGKFAHARVTLIVHPGFRRSDIFGHDQALAGVVVQHDETRCNAWLPHCPPDRPPFSSGPHNTP